MADPRPANDSAPIRPSLFDRAVRAARSAPRAPAPPEPQPRPRIDRVAIAVAAAIVATPLLTLIGATLLTGRVRADTRLLTERSAPTIAARADCDRARALLTAAWGTPTLGSTVEAVARALPDDAAVLRVQRNAGPLTIDVAAPDPDRVLTALGRDPALGGLRAVTQTRAADDGRMQITLEQPR